MSWTKPNLGQGEVRFGFPLYRYDSLSSTQDTAREYAERNLQPGLTVSARQMTAGRGRLGRGWVTPPGANVCLTTVAPPVATQDIWQVAIVAGLATCRAVNMVAPAVNARIRFPNDVYVGTRKLAGILVETVLSDAAGQRVPLVGIGINVRQVPLPPEIVDRAVSLEEASGSAFPVPDVETALFAALTDCWQRWHQHGFAALLAPWHDLLDRDAERTFVLDGATVPCRVLTLAEDGHVTIGTQSGARHSVHVAHILFGEDSPAYK